MFVCWAGEYLWLNHVDEDGSSSIVGEMRWEITLEIGLGKKNERKKNWIIEKWRQKRKVEGPGEEEGKEDGGVYGCDVEIVKFISAYALLKSPWCQTEPVQLCTEAPLQCHVRPYTCRLPHPKEMENAKELLTSSALSFRNIWPFSPWPCNSILRQISRDLSDSPFSSLPCSLL